MKEIRERLFEMFDESANPIFKIQMFQSIAGYIWLLHVTQSTMYMYVPGIKCVCPGYSVQSTCMFRVSRLYQECVSRLPPVNRRGTAGCQDRVKFDWRRLAKCAGPADICGVRRAGRRRSSSLWRGRSPKWQSVRQESQSVRQIPLRTRRRIESCPAAS